MVLLARHVLGKLGRGGPLREQLDVAELRLQEAQQLWQGCARAVGQIPELVERLCREQQRCHRFEFCEPRLLHARRMLVPGLAVQSDISAGQSHGYFAVLGKEAVQLGVILGAGPEVEFWAGQRGRALELVALEPSGEVLRGAVVGAPLAVVDVDVRCARASAYTLAAQRSETVQEGLDAWAPGAGGVSALDLPDYPVAPSPQAASADPSEPSVESVEPLPRRGAPVFAKGSKDRATVW